ncbi:MAG: ABC transporter substrate-binding protein [Dehalococcoidia bacterium]
MKQKAGFWYKIAALVLVLILLVPILAACGDDDENKTPTPTATTPVAAIPAKTTPVAQPTVAPTASTPALTPTKTVSKEPVKIGCLSSWTGPAAMAGILSDQAIAVVKNQVAKMGGILGGRPIEFIKYDDGGTVAGATAGIKKSSFEDNVSAVVWGGASAASIAAASDAAEDAKKAPIFFIAAVPENLTERPYSVRARYSLTSAVDTVTYLILNNLKAKKVAIMADDMEEARHRMDMIGNKLNAAGVSIVSSQFIPLGTVDFASYLTKLKYSNPDVVAVLFSTEACHMAVFKQIMELGGWGNIKYVSTTDGGTGAKTISLPGAKDSYHWVTWVPGLPYPGAKEFEQSFLETHGRAPTPLNVVHYIPLWLAIKAIELAGTDDPQAVARAARSGHLQWESPAGPITVSPDGEPGLSGSMVQVGEGGKLTVVK